MSGSLITFPVRLGTRGAGLALRGAQALTDRVVGVVEFAVTVIGRSGSSDHRFGATPDEAGAREPSEAVAPTPATPVRPRPSPSPSRSTSAPVGHERTEPVVTADLGSLSAEPVHVSEEPVLVQAVAESGAEDGAGAQITVAEPWSGYRAMKAADVIDRIATATPAQLAAIELYELSARKRTSVVTAAQQALARSTRARQ
jgi:hypothetical protein